MNGRDKYGSIDVGPLVGDGRQGRSGAALGGAADAIVLGIPFQLVLILVLIRRQLVELSRTRDNHLSPLQSPQSSRLALGYLVRGRLRRAL